MFQLGAVLKHVGQKARDIVSMSICLPGTVCANFILLYVDPSVFATFNHLKCNNGAVRVIITPLHPAPYPLRKLEQHLFEPEQGRRTKTKTKKGAGCPDRKSVV